MLYAHKCPSCGGIMDFHMDYNCGIPYVFYTCPCCKYDSRYHNTIITTTTTRPPEQEKPYYTI